MRGAIGKVDVKLVGRAAPRDRTRAAAASRYLSVPSPFRLAVASRMFAFGTDNVGREGFFLGALSVTMANDRKLLVEGESLHQRLATGHHP